MVTRLAGLLVASCASAIAAAAPIGWDFDNDGREDLLVGRPVFDYAALTYGQVEVYSTLQQSLDGTATSLTGDDLFGLSTSSVGDIDGDGHDDYAVGAMAWNANATDKADSGRIALYSGFDHSLIQDIWIDDPQVKMVGRTVAGVGDVDGDSVPDIAAAGYYMDSIGGLQEEVYVFSGVDGALVRIIQTALGNDMFGFSMTGLGDITGDGIGDFAVSAPNANPIDQTDLYGRVYVFAGQTRGAQATFETAGAAYTTIVSEDPTLSLGTFLLHGTDETADGKSELVILSAVTEGPDQYLYVAESVDVATNQRIIIQPPADPGGRGDTNRDLQIDAADIQALIVIYGLPTDPNDPFNGDFNDDGVVDNLDLNDALAAYGGQHPLAAITASSGQLMQMTVEVAVEWQIQGTNHCGRPVRATYFPGVNWTCDTYPLATWQDQALDFAVWGVGPNKPWSNTPSPEGLFCAPQHLTCIVPLPVSPDTGPSVIPPRNARQMVG